MNIQKEPDLAYIYEKRFVYRIRDLIQEEAKKQNLVDEKYAPEFERAISFMSLIGSQTESISLLGVSGYLMWLLLKCQYYDNSQWN